MNLKPIKNQLVVRPDPPPTQLGGIYMPDTVLADNPNYFPMTGVVVALGRTSYDDAGEVEQPFAVAIGDRVLFNRYAGKQITCDDDRVTYLVMRESEILGLVDGEAHQVLPGDVDAGDGGVQSLPGDRRL